MPRCDWWIFWHLRWDKSHSGSPLAAQPGLATARWQVISHTCPELREAETIVNKCEKLMHFSAAHCYRDQFVLFVYLAVTKYCNLEIISPETRGPPVTGQQWPAMTGWQIVSAPASTHPMSDVTPVTIGITWEHLRRFLRANHQSTKLCWSSSASPTLADKSLSASALFVWLCWLLSASQFLFGCKFKCLTLAGIIVACQGRASDPSLTWSVSHQPGQGTPVWEPGSLHQTADRCLVLPPTRC